MAAMPEWNRGQSRKEVEVKNPGKIFARFPAENKGFRLGWPDF